MTLLDKAREFPSRQAKYLVTDETIQLALAWARGEIGLKAINHALNIRLKTSGGNAAYSLMARSLAAYIRNQQHGSRENSSDRS